MIFRDELSVIAPVGTYFCARLPLMWLFVGFVAMTSCSNKPTREDQQVPFKAPTRESKSASSRATASSALSKKKANTSNNRAKSPPSVPERHRKKTVAFPAESESEGTKIVRFVLAERIQAREPVGVKTTFARGERVYAFLELNNEKGALSSVRVRFQRQDGPNTRGIRLEVPRMKRYRTNAFTGSTYKPGKYHCIVSTEDGRTLAELAFQVVGGSG